MYFTGGLRYTGHEHLPQFSLINMNGRVYDPVLGMMLSPDNFVQEPDNTQNFNRYGYCLNNPLKYLDPTGNFFLDWLLGKNSVIRKVGAFAWNAVLGTAIASVVIASFVVTVAVVTVASILTLGQITGSEDAGTALGFIIGPYTGTLLWYNLELPWLRKQINYIWSHWALDY